MKVQLIGINGKSTQLPKGFIESTFVEPSSLDEFDLNVVFLTDPKIWTNNASHHENINMCADFQSVKQMVKNRRKAKILFVFPQNMEFRYYLHPSKNEYLSSIPLKDMIKEIHYILKYILPDNINLYELFYEKTRTNVGGREYKADFYFNNYKGITKSISSEKPTTIELRSDVYATTLDLLTSIDDLTMYLRCIFEGVKKEKEPEWFDGIQFADDNIQAQVIEEMNAMIEQALQAIDDAKGILERNKRYKSILYTNGEELTEVVFDILEQLLNCSLKQFVDLKKEDFRIETDAYTLIGEIKGVTSNVKYEHVSQINTHYFGYIDENLNVDISKIHQILIINPLRSKTPKEREPVHINQIKLAERNGCLIIETNTLLRLYESFLKKQVTTEQCVRAFCEQTGLLDLNTIV